MLLQKQRNASRRTFLHAVRLLHARREHFRMEFTWRPGFVSEVDGKWHTRGEDERLGITVLCAQKDFGAFIRMVGGEVRGISFTRLPPDFTAEAQRPQRGAEDGKSSSAALSQTSAHLRSDEAPPL